MADGQKRRREEPAVRRAQIVEAAKRSFRTFGLQATTVDRIASEAGVSVGLLYRFFRSKAAIVEAIIVEDVELQLERTALVLEETRGDFRRLPQLIAAGVTEVSADRERLALMLEIAAEVCRNGELRAFIREKRAALREILSARLEESGMERAATARLIDQLDAASAVASGLAVYMMVHSEASRLPQDLLQKLMTSAMMSTEGNRGPARGA